MTCTAMLTALGILVPFLFHQVGIAGKVFLPMHFPVLIAGMLLGPTAGLTAGLLSPALSSLLTGMPPLPLTVVMVPELMTYGAISGLLYRAFGGRVWIALPGAMLAGRVVMGFAAWIALGLGLLGLRITPQAFLYGAVITGLPGILSQIVLIPLLMWRISSKPGVAGDIRVPPS